MGTITNYFCRNFKWSRKKEVILVLFLFLIFPSLAGAISWKNYFQISLEPIVFSKSEIKGREIFYITLQAKATSLKNFPITAKEAKIMSRIIAKNILTNEQQKLNSAYIVNIKPFPKKKDEQYQIRKQLSLRFPPKSQEGDYLIIAKLVKAEVKLPLIGWRDVTNYLPLSRQLGVVKYTLGKIKTAN